MIVGHLPDLVSQVPYPGCLIRHVGYKPPWHFGHSHLYSLGLLRFATNPIGPLRLTTVVMAANRSAGRDVHIYDTRDPNTVLGGLILTNGVTNANFYSMREMFLLIDSNYVLRHEDGMELQRNDQSLRRGSYFIVTNGWYLLLWLS